MGKKKWIFLLLGIVIAAVLGAGYYYKTLPNLTSNPLKREVKHGGQLVYGTLQEPDTLNPLLSELEATAEVGSMIFNGLVTINDKGQWMADLAEVPTLQNGGVSADGLTIVYRLRSNVKWHDGRAFTAEDVKYTWQFIMNPKVNVVSREGYDKIKSIDTPDQTTVIIRFKEYYVNYLTLFNVILPKHILEREPNLNKAAFNRAPIGTGPFRFKEWRLAEAVVLENNPQFFRGKPNLDTIFYKVIPDANIMLLQLKQGEVDIVTDVPFQMVDQVKDITTIKTVVTPSLIWEHLDFNLDSNLFRDVRVRQAIALGIDRQALTANVLKNTATPAFTDQSPLSWAYNPPVKPDTRDIQGARDLLISAGWKMGEDGVFAKDRVKLAFHLDFPVTSKYRETVASVIKQQLREVGILVELNPVDPKVFFNDVLKKRSFDMAMYAWVAGIEPNNYNLWHSRSVPGRSNDFEGKNYPGWRNAEVDMLTERAWRTLDQESRKQMYYRIQDIITQEYPIIPLYFRGNIDAVSNNVGNYRPNPTQAGSLWNVWEWGLWSK